MNVYYDERYLSLPFLLSAIRNYVLSFILISISLAILTSPLVLWLWNWLMPALFEFQQISWLQSIGLTLLARLLFASR